MEHEDWPKWLHMPNPPRLSQDADTDEGDDEEGGDELVFDDHVINVVHPDEGHIVEVRIYPVNSRGLHQAHEIGREHHLLINADLHEGIMAGLLVPLLHLAGKEYLTGYGTPAERASLAALHLTRGLEAGDLTSGWHIGGTWTESTHYVRVRPATYDGDFRDDGAPIVSAHHFTWWRVRIDHPDNDAHYPMVITAGGRDPEEIATAVIKGHQHVIWPRNTPSESKYHPDTAKYLRTLAVEVAAVYTGVYAGVHG